MQPLLPQKLQPVAPEISSTFRINHKPPLLNDKKIGWKIILAENEPPLIARFPTKLFGVMIMNCAKRSTMHQLSATGLSSSV
ncbi:hypothetical protein SLA2020_056670 [Shorea laevis]